MVGRNHNTTHAFTVRDPGVFGSLHTGNLGSLLLAKGYSDSYFGVPINIITEANSKNY